MAAPATVHALVAVGGAGEEEWDVNVLEMTAVGILSGLHADTLFGGLFEGVDDLGDCRVYLATARAAAAGGAGAEDTGADGGVGEGEVELTCTDDMMVGEVEARKVSNVCGMDYVHLRIALPPADICGGVDAPVVCNLKPAVDASPTMVAPTHVHTRILDMEDYVEYTAAPVTVDVSDVVRAAGAALFKLAGGSHECLLSESRFTKLVNNMHRPAGPAEDTRELLVPGFSGSTKRWRTS